MATRRTILKVGLLGAPTVVAGAAGVAGVLYGTGDLDTAGRIDFRNRLAIPPLAPSRLDRDGRRVFDLRAAAGRHGFRDGALTSTWGINGNYLGPTVRAKRGETVLVNLRNDVPEATTMHWHGMHLPAAMDGGPHQMVEPGATWSPTWTVDQPAATLWYHPHPHGATARHAYRGLAGLWIIDDDLGDRDGVPHRYGVDDIPVIVQDKNFTEDNRLDESHRAMSASGILGDVVCVNGTVAPYLPVTTERVRLRLLNASNGRFYQFGLADGREFALIGTDGGFLTAPHPIRRIALSPGERAEIVVSLSPGERVALRSYAPDLGLNVWDERFSGGDDTLDILELRAAGALAPSPPLPDRLAPAPDLDTGAVAATRTFALSGFTINGQTMDMNRIDTVVTVDTTEVWEVTAVDDAAHNFHVHDVQFQVLSVGGAAPPPELRGWKDTIHTPPRVPIRIALRFRDYADRSTPYMFHCHVLFHEDGGLMGQFLVLAPGDTPGTPRHHSPDTAP